MKSAKDIEKEIDDQIKRLKKKKVEPEIIILGTMAYYTLKVSNKELVEHVPNSGSYLKEWKGIKMIQQPIYESGGVFKEEHESVEVFGR